MRADGGGELSRRTLLRAAGLGAAGSALLAGCGRALSSDHGALLDFSSEVTVIGPQADDITGAFSWRRQSSTPLKLLLVEHPYTTAALGDIDDFRRLTGIDVTWEVVSQRDYFNTVTGALIDARAGHDVFMTGTYLIWQYAPPGWMEDLQPWLDNSSATSPDLDLDDIYHFLLAADRWSLNNGRPTGLGGRWALPWGWEPSVFTYRGDEFSRLGLRPPETMDELVDVAAGYQEASRRSQPADSCGIAVQGMRSWASIYSGFMTQFTREGAQDFISSQGMQLTPEFNSSTSIAFHQKWMGMVSRSGPSDWTSYDHAACLNDLAAGRTGMIFDGIAGTAGLNTRPHGPATGSLAWHPGPSGPTGLRSTSFWAWSLAINSRSAHKPAAWLFLQWATGRRHLKRAALEYDHGVPVRRSVAEHPLYRAKMGRHAGYLETVDAVRDTCAVLFTPQSHFLDIGTRWSEALLDIWAGDDITDRLDRLSREISGRL